MIPEIIFLIQTLLVRIGNNQLMIYLFIYLISMLTVEKGKQMYDICYVIISDALHKANYESIMIPICQNHFSMYSTLQKFRVSIIKNKEINTLILQQKHIILIKSDTKDIYDITEISISNKCCLKFFLSSK